jgi:acyl carrier protein
VIDESEILQRLIKVVATVFMAEPITLGADTNAEDVPGWDSVSQVMLIMQIEDEFALSLAPELVNAAQNLGELALIITKLRRTHDEDTCSVL